MKQCIVIFLAIAGVLAMTRCDKPGNEAVCDCMPFPQGDTFTVRIKEKVTVYNCCDDRFSIAFKTVKEDSRCPDGFNCLAMNPLWEGTARISIKLDNLQSAELRINEPAVVRYGGHDYTLLLTALTPHPKSGLPTDPDSYKAEIRVNRN